MLKETALADFHRKRGGKMVPFAGFNMPVQYADGILASHHHTREHASIFDVSHMIQLRCVSLGRGRADRRSIHGKDRVKFMEGLVVASVAELKPSSGVLSFFSNEQGGVKDDLIIHNFEDKALHVVANAGCAAKDVAHLKARCDTTHITPLSSRCTGAPGGIQGRRVAGDPGPVADCAAGHVPACCGRRHAAQAPRRTWRWPS